jgi:probable phosphoglycerate mutase
MTELYLIRHGQSFGNVQTPDALMSDRGLTALGIEQCERLRDRLLATREIQPEVFIVSTLPRTRQTAQIIAPAFGSLPMIFDDEVQEIRASPELDQLTQTEAIAKFGAPYYEENFFNPLFGGENWGGFLLRVGMAIHRIVTEHAGKRIVIVSHGGFIDSSILYFGHISSLHLPPLAFYTRNTSITHWHLRKFALHSQEQWTLMKYNDDLHTKDIGLPQRINWKALATIPEPEEHPSVPLATEPEE